MSKISEKKKVFARVYLATADAEKSALEAGYKSSYGARLLKDKEVLEYMSGLDSTAKIATADEVMSFLTSVMRGEEWEIKVTVKKDSGEKMLLGEPPTLSQRQKAAELLAKRYRLFSENVNEDGGDKTFSVNIKVV